MDRFIGFLLLEKLMILLPLKSNMDRFIGSVKSIIDFLGFSFKIQYG